MLVQVSAAYPALAVLALACRSGPGERRAAAPPPATVASNSAVMEIAPDSLGLELVLPRRVRAGDLVPIDLRLANRTDRPLTLYLRGREITFDVTVRHPDGERVWQRLEGAGVLAILQVREMAPEETITLRHVWDQRDRAGRPVPAGSYVVEASILTDGEPLRAPTKPLLIQ